jgi:hypothetical protein
MQKPTHFCLWWLSNMFCVIIVWYAPLHYSMHFTYGKIPQSVKLMCKHVYINKWQMDREFVVKFWSHKRQCRKTSHLPLHLLFCTIWPSKIVLGNISLVVTNKLGYTIPKAFMATWVGNLVSNFWIQNYTTLAKHPQNHIIELKIKQNKIK